jgi:hypothetical protein
MTTHEKSFFGDATDDQDTLVEKRTIQGEEDRNSSAKARDETHISPIEANMEKSPALEAPPEPEWEYVTGFKRYTVISVVTLVAFLMLLDTSIVATVRTQFFGCRRRVDSKLGNP